MSLNWDLHAGEDKCYAAGCVQAVGMEFIVQYLYVRLIELSSISLTNLVLLRHLNMRTIKKDSWYNPHLTIHNYSILKKQFSIHKQKRRAKVKIKPSIVKT